MEHKYFRGPDGLHQICLVRHDGQRVTVRLGDKELEVARIPLGEHRFLLRLPDRQVVVDWARRDRDVFLQFDGEGFHLQEEDAAHSLAEGDHGEQAEPNLNAPLPGKVVKVLVKPGDEVRKGQPLLIIDSMKVEFELKAHRQGIIDQILVQEGKQLDMGQGLVIFR